MNTLVLSQIYFLNSYTSVVLAEIVSHFISEKLYILSLITVMILLSSCRSLESPGKRAFMRSCLY